MPDSDRPTMAKAPPELIQRFDQFVSRFDGVERRKMFGYPSLFVGGNLVTGLHASMWIVRLPEDEIQELLATPGAAPFAPMPGRPMKGYATLPPAMVDDDEALERWVNRAIAFGRTLPPKAK